MAFQQTEQTGSQTESCAVLLAPLKFPSNQSAALINFAISKKLINAQTDLKDTTTEKLFSLIDKALCKPENQSIREEFTKLIAEIRNPIPVSPGIFPLASQPDLPKKESETTKPEISDEQLQEFLNPLQTNIDFQKLEPGERQILKARVAQFVTKLGEQIDSLDLDDSQIELRGSLERERIAKFTRAFSRFGIIQDVSDLGLVFDSYIALERAFLTNAEGFQKAIEGIDHISLFCVDTGIKKQNFFKNLPEAIDDKGDAFLVAIDNIIPVIDSTALRTQLTPADSRVRDFQTLNKFSTDVHSLTRLFNGATQTDTRLISETVFYLEKLNINFSELGRSFNRQLIDSKIPPLMTASQMTSGTSFESFSKMKSVNDLGIELTHSGNQEQKYRNIQLAYLVHDLTHTTSDQTPKNLSPVVAQFMSANPSQQISKAELEWMGAALAANGLVDDSRGRFIEFSPSVSQAHLDSAISELGIKGKLLTPENRESAANLSKALESYWGVGTIAPQVFLNILLDKPKRDFFLSEKNAENFRKTKLAAEGTDIKSPDSSFKITDPVTIMQMAPK